MIYRKEFLKLYLIFLIFLIARFFGIVPNMISVCLIVLYYFPSFARNFQSVPHRKVSMVVLFFFFSFSLFYLALSELILITYFPPSTELSWDHPYSLLLVSMHSVTFYVVIKRANDIVNWLKSYKSQHRKNVVVTVKKRIR
ncbi:uncharacterized protein LOC111620243 [Centruroides sculpturatus]|uniref:uncharacterized protein LOC111620243 n=1 Tax=Centruroides sculpturatus TaxID=218467 RepID=UPI000C6EF3ED|nr:uncharacterized protein LOC111620243 [Centruroides sculpturatus]